MVNPAKKGARGEKELVELCKKWWNSDDFMRSPESGALSTMMEQWGAPEDIAGRLAGDLLTPIDFCFCIESKRYKEVNLYSVITNRENNKLRQWWDQCKADAHRAKKIPLLSFREDRKDRYIIISIESIERLNGDIDGQYNKAWMDFYLGYDYVRLMLWDDFVKEYTKEHVLEAWNQ